MFQQVLKKIHNRFLSFLRYYTVLQVLFDSQITEIKTKKSHEQLNRFLHSCSIVLSLYLLIHIIIDFHIPQWQWIEVIASNAH
jgi:hypothetical protein